MDGQGGCMGGGDLRSHSPVTSNSHELTDYTCYQGLVPSVLV